MNILEMMHESAHAVRVFLLAVLAASLFAMCGSRHSDSKIPKFKFPPCSYIIQSVYPDNVGHKQHKKLGSLVNASVNIDYKDGSLYLPSNSFRNTVEINFFDTTGLQYRGDSEKLLMPAWDTLHGTNFYLERVHGFQSFYQLHILEGRTQIRCYNLIAVDRE